MAEAKDPIIKSSLKVLGALHNATGKLKSKMEDVAAPVDTAGIQYYKPPTTWEYFRYGFNEWLNRLRHNLQTIGLFAARILLVPMPLVLLMMFIFTSAADRDQFWTIPLAHFFEMVGMGDEALSINLGPGLGEVTRSASDISLKATSKWWPHFFLFGFFWLLAAWPSRIYAQKLFKEIVAIGKPVLDNLYIRGAKVTDVPGLNKAIHEDEERKKIKKLWKPPLIQIDLGGVILPSDRELRGFYINGTTGSGKTVALKHIAKAIKEAGHKAIFHDPAAEFDEMFYEDDHIIFNPYDARWQDNWDIWSEFRFETDYLDLSAALLPEKSEESEWITDIARPVLAGFFQATSNWEEFREVILSSLEDKVELLVGTVGQGKLKITKFGGDKGTTYALSAIESLYTKTFADLRSPKPGVKKFSLRDWVSDDDDRRWIYLVNPSNLRNRLAPLFTLVFEIIGRELLSLEKNSDKPRDEQRRVWIVLEESPCLPPIPILPELTATGRKYGACWIILTQDLSQLEDKKSYDKEVAKALRQTCNTWLIFQSPDGDSAEIISKQIGTYEEVQKAKSTSGSYEDVDGDGFGLRETIAERQAILPSQIQGLPELSCFLMLFGTLPTAQIELDFIDFEPRIKGFIMRDDIILKRDADGRIIRPSNANSDVIDSTATVVMETPSIASITKAEEKNEPIAIASSSVFDLDGVLSDHQETSVPVCESDLPPSQALPQESVIDDVLRDLLGEAPVTKRKDEVIDDERPWLKSLSN